MNIPTGRRWGWVEHCYLRFQRVEKPSGCVVKEEAESERIYSELWSDYCLLATLLRKLDTFTDACLQLLTAPQKIKNNSRRWARTPVLPSRAGAAELTKLSYTLYSKEETGGQVHSIPLRLVTGATVTLITEGRNVQKEAETLQLDFRDNMNKEELSFG